MLNPTDQDVIRRADACTGAAERTPRAPIELGGCPRCGQLLITDATVCGACRQHDRAPQGEPLALFHAPATPRPPVGGMDQGDLFQ